jgi:hypothetical protein
MPLTETNLRNHRRHLLYESTRFSPSLAFFSNNRGPRHRETLRSTDHEPPQSTAGHASIRVNYHYH